MRLPPARAPSLSTASQEADQLTSRRIGHLNRALLAVAPAQKEVDMLPLLVNPGSFSQTVENLFDMSTLVRRGDVRVRVDEDMTPKMGAPPHSGHADLG